MKNTYRRQAYFGCFMILSTVGCSKQEETQADVRRVHTMHVSETTDLVGRVFSGRVEAVLAGDIMFEVSGQLIERAIQVGKKRVGHFVSVEATHSQFGQLNEAKNWMLSQSAQH